MTIRSAPFGILDLFGWQNIRALRGGAMIEPRHRWTVTALARQRHRRAL